LVYSPMNRGETEALRPLLKWAGGKRQVLPAIRPFVPQNFKVYIEPFLGGGAVLFDLAPIHAYVSDVNSELIFMYEVVRDNPDELISVMKKMKVESEEFYAIREWDRDPDSFTRKTKIERAARTIYLNRTGYNGLYRVNSKNEFNVPFGRYVNPTICDEELIRSVSAYLKNNSITLRSEDFRTAIARAGEGDFIYVDPPYAPLDDAQSTFTSYTSAGFTHKDLLDLRESLKLASERGASWLLSNVKSKKMHRLFPRSKYHVTEISVARTISSNAAGRGPVPELLITSRSRF